MFIICALDIVLVTSHLPQSHLTFTQDNFGILTLHGCKADVRWLMGFWTAKCPLHPTKSPCISHETTLACSPCMDTRWMRGDLWGSGLQSVLSTTQSHLMWHVRQLCILTLCGCKVTLCPLYCTKSPCVTCKTTLASSPHVDARWLMGFWIMKCPLHHTKTPHVTHETALHSPLVRTWGDFVSPPPHKVTLCNTWNNFGILTSCAPLHTKIISFTLHGKIPKKVTKQPRFHQ